MVDALVRLASCLTSSATTSQPPLFMGPRSMAVLGGPTGWSAWRWWRSPGDAPTLAAGFSPSPDPLGDHVAAMRHGPLARPSTCSPCLACCSGLAGPGVGNVAGHIPGADRHLLSMAAATESSLWL